MLQNHERESTFIAAAAVALALLAPLPATASCFEEAAQYHSVNPWILRAIAAQESRFYPTAKHRRNKDGTLEPELSRDYCRRPP